METAHGSAAEFLEADIDFHLAIGQAAHNSILLNALHLIRNLLQKWIGATLKLDGVEAKALDHHRAIFLAIAKKNVPAAQAAMQVTSKKWRAIT
jgi:GntR family transcriptional repressor for pyruvate dehydrogenase complex